eukprot:s2939_g5.t1
MASPDGAASELELTGLSLALCEKLNGEYNVKYKDRMTKKGLEILFPLMTLPDSMVLMYGKLSRCTLPVLGPAVLMLGGTDCQKHEGTLEESCKAIFRDIKTDGLHHSPDSSIVYGTSEGTNVALESTSIAFVKDGQKTKRCESEMVNGVEATRHALVIKICPEKYALLEHAAAACSESDAAAAGLFSRSPKADKPNEDCTMTAGSETKPGSEFESEMMA